MKDLYQKLDLLTSQWQELETLITGIGVDSENLKLDRYHGKMRLLYKEKAISECSAVEKVEAVTEVEKLYGNYMLKFNNMMKETHQATIILGEWIAKFREAIHGNQKS